MTATPMPSTVAHLDALIADVEHGYLIVSTIDPTDTSSRWRSASFAHDEVDAAASFARSADDAGHNVYVRTNLLGRRIEPWERGKHSDTAVAVAFAVDLDVMGPGHKQAQTELQLPRSIDEAMSIVSEAPTPSLTIDTGGGVHLWWLLDEPHTDEPVKLLEQWADRIVAAGAERNLLVDRPDASRVLRVAGTHRRKPGVPTNRVVLADVAGWPIEGLARRPWRPAGRYAASDLLECLPAPETHRVDAPAPVAPRRHHTGNVGPADAVGRLSWADIFEPSGWTFVGMSTVDGTPVELWQRPGGTSDYSAKCFPDGPAVVWSDACGLPAGRGQRLNKWRVFVHLYFHGNESDAARSIRLASRSVAA